MQQGAPIHDHKTKIHLIPLSDFFTTHLPTGRFYRVTQNRCRPRTYNDSIDYSLQIARQIFEVDGQ